MECAQLPSLSANSFSDTWCRRSTSCLSPFHAWPCQVAQLDVEKAAAARVEDVQVLLAVPCRVQHPVAAP